MINQVAIYGRVDANYEANISKSGNPYSKQEIMILKSGEWVPVEMMLFGHNCKQWDDKVKKGDWVYVSGRLDVTKLTSKAGNEFLKVQVICESFAIDGQKKEEVEGVEGDIVVEQQEELGNPF